MTEDVYKPGLEGVIAGETTISSVQQDGLYYRGYNIKDLADHASFGETIFLLLKGELPTTAQLQGVRDKLDEYRPLPGAVMDMLRSIPKEVNTMDVLRTAVSMADHFCPVRGEDEEAWYQRTLYFTSQSTGIIAARHRIMNGQEPVQPKSGLSHAEQFLYQFHGKDPDPTAVELIDLTLILYAEHEFNASTFVARVCASTLSDVASCIVGGIGTLKGSLHGGANEKAMDMLLKFKTAEEARQGTLQAIKNKDKIMGFGHRVYKSGDHRARILEDKMVSLAKKLGQEQWIDIYMAVKNTMGDEKGIFPNVDYPCGLVYYLMDLPTDVYTPLFVASRVVGWAAHAAEQHFNNRIIRPRSKYTGPAIRPYASIDQRG